MSFGFSVGDFLAVSKLAKDIISSLKDSGGSRTDYQNLARELECLQAALIHLDRLTATRTPQDLAAIKYAALSCRRPLEEFLVRIRKYDRSLGIQSRPNPVKGVIDKITFPLTSRDEVQKLQAYLSVHIGTINILLAEYGLESMQLATETTESSQIKMKTWLENTDSLLSGMQTSVVSKMNAVLENITSLEKVYRILSGELKASLQLFQDAVANVCVSTQQIYAVILEIQASITATPDIRWTFFQEPLIVEDALGRKFPVPSEYDYSLLNAVIKHKFRDGPGAAQVAAGDYEIMYARNRHHILSNNSRLRPGCSITMAILVGKPHSAALNCECCPMPQCHSNNTIAVPGGGRQCLHCAVWFDQSKKKLSLLQGVWVVHETLLTVDQSNSNTDWEEIGARDYTEAVEDDSSISLFKNVKLADRKQVKKNAKPTHCEATDENLTLIDRKIAKSHVEITDLEAVADREATRQETKLSELEATRIWRWLNSQTDFLNLAYHAYWINVPNSIQQDEKRLYGNAFQNGYMYTGRHSVATLSSLFDSELAQLVD
ncbi:uncharacterized protein F4807DRAFT_168689 [Annulohypoxylon truncatum]|uniref:uncharacterized protein n=1 Tax=Annulohypoxylon truncatum TaxID=327061 RepID=UPI0020082AF5|nr:uncharacterized protein F4807DRAFT_168689 [Annulohypoxylon truncatum]KAI1207866.1 hypothetical protein F4807DRAFT_168689 [Annulohypoxylon truncatum]